MGIQVVTYKYYPFGIRVVLIRQPLYLQGSVATLPRYVYIDHPPSAKRLARHEGTACSFPYIFMVDLPCMVGLCGDLFVSGCFRLIPLVMIKPKKREKS